MIHASDLRSHTLCGHANQKLPEGDRCFAALLPETMADVSCPECRRKLGLRVVYMRVLGTDHTPLRLEPVEGSLLLVRVPGFGFLYVETDETHAKFGKALTIHPRGDDPDDMTITEHDAVRVDGRIEIELLHKADRLCVVIEP